MATTFCVFGLGESGTRVATDLIEAGVDVFAYDPAPVATPPGVRRAPHPALAVARADVVAAVVPPKYAKLALLQALDAIPGSAVFADFTSGLPVAKRQLADIAVRNELAFAEVVPATPLASGGLRSPLQVVGRGAASLVEQLSPIGLAASEIDAPVGGVNARRYLRRSALVGVAAVLSEALAAAESLGDEAWLRSELDAVIGAGGSEWLADLVAAAAATSEEAVLEVRESSALLQTLGIPPTMTDATVATIAGLVASPSPT